MTMQMLTQMARGTLSPEDFDLIIGCAARALILEHNLPRELHGMPVTERMAFALLGLLTGPRREEVLSELRKSAHAHASPDELEQLAAISRTLGYVGGTP